jgi:hypothetical protein
MLVIRDAQMKVLGDDARARFEAQLRDVFLAVYPRECRQAGGPTAVLDWVRHGLQAAQAAGHDSGQEGSRWVALTMMLGVDFAVDPQLPWVREALDDADGADGAARLDRLYARTVDYLGATAGEDAELVVRALLRIRAIDYAAIAPQHDEAAAVADACTRLQALYPAKFAFQGAELTARTVAQDRARARAHGLQDAGAQFLFVLLGFMLGSGFDHDPLHGWAGRALREGDVADRAARLQAATLAHVELSLGGG